MSVCLRHVETIGFPSLISPLYAAKKGEQRKIFAPYLNPLSYNRFCKRLLFIFPRGCATAVKGQGHQNRAN